ncbi:MAG: GDSL-like Lipase/Acylhydrolase family protein, partial [Oscillospiraceae bacterium]|nr:GDSL-like Lipase/Acylhydrolase family protein [Oscillospiraceae bacterium]
MKIQNNDTVIFLGDSITDCGRSMPNGEGGNGFGTYGHGYPNYFIAIFKAKHPDWQVRFVNKGISGNQTRHILDRLEN